MVTRDRVSFPAGCAGSKRELQGPRLAGMVELVLGLGKELVEVMFFSDAGLGRGIEARSASSVCK